MVRTSPARDVDDHRTSSHRFCKDCIWRSRGARETSLLSLGRDFEEGLGHKLGGWGHEVKQECCDLMSSAENALLDDFQVPKQLWVWTCCQSNCTLTQHGQLEGDLSSMFGSQWKIICKQMSRSKVVRQNRKSSRFHLDLGRAEKWSKCLEETRARLLVNLPCDAKCSVAPSVLLRDRLSRMPKVHLV